MRNKIINVMNCVFAGAFVYGGLHSAFKELVFGDTISAAVLIALWAILISSRTTISIERK